MPSSKAQLLPPDASMSACTHCNAVVCGPCLPAFASGFARGINWMQGGRMRTSHVAHWQVDLVLTARAPQLPFTCHRPCACFTHRGDGVDVLLLLHCLFSQTAGHLLKSRCPMANELGRTSGTSFVNPEMWALRRPAVTTRPSIARRVIPQSVDPDCRSRGRSVSGSGLQAQVGYVAQHVIRLPALQCCCQLQMLQMLAGKGTVRVALRGGALVGIVAKVRGTSRAHCTARVGQCITASRVRWAARLGTAAGCSRQQFTTGHSNIAEGGQYRRHTAVAHRRHLRVRHPPRGPSCVHGR